MQLGTLPLHSLQTASTFSDDKWWLNLLGFVIIDAISEGVQHMLNENIFLEWECE